MAAPPTLEYSTTNPNTTLKELTFPAGSTFGYGIFTNCTALETVTFQGDATVNSGAFNNNPVLKDVTFEGNATVNNAFSYGYGETVTFKGDAAVSNSAFSNNVGLKTVIFQGSAEVLSSAFYNNIALETVTFGGESNIYNGAFDCNPNLATVTFAEKTSITNGSFSCIETVPNTKLKELTFPAGSVFGPSIFMYYNGLESITFQGDADVSAGGCFGVVPGLKTLTFQGKSTLGNGSFTNCASLQTVTFGDAATLKPSALTSNTFTSEALDPIVLPAGSSLGEGALSKVPISSVEFKDATPGTIGVNAFNDCPADAVIYVPCGSVEAYTAALNEGATPANPDGLAIDSHHNVGNWTGDDTNHWKPCTNAGCTVKLEEGPHTGTTATCKDKAYCSVCETSYGKVADHNYTGSPWVSLGETGHTRTCIWCEVPDAEATHVFEDQYDPDCADCGYTRQVEERPATEQTQPPKANTPETADGTDLSLLMLVFFGSACLLAGILLSKKRNII